MHYVVFRYKGLMGVFDTFKVARDYALTRFLNHDVSIVLMDGAQDIEQWRNRNEIEAAPEEGPKVRLGRVGHDVCIWIMDDGSAIRTVWRPDQGRTEALHGKSVKTSVPGYDHIGAIESLGYTVVSGEVG